MVDVLPQMVALSETYMQVYRLQQHEQDQQPQGQPQGQQGPQ